MATRVPILSMAHFAPRLSQGHTANTLDRTDNWGGQRALRSRACNRYRHGTEIDKIREFEELAKVLLTVQM